MKRFGPYRSNLVHHQTKNRLACFPTRDQRREMRKHSMNQRDPNENGTSSEQINMLVSNSEKMASRLDIVTNILLDILLSNDTAKSVSYTDKAVYLQSLGVPIDDISRIVARPSKSVSSRLRESKLRKSSRRQQKTDRTASSAQESDQATT